MKLRLTGSPDVDACWHFTLGSLNFFHLAADALESRGLDTLVSVLDSDLSSRC